MSDSIGKIQLDLETNYKPFQKQLTDISSKTAPMVSSAFSKIGLAIGGAFAVNKLIDFGRASINLASSLAEVQNVVDTVFKSSANTVNNFTKNALSSFGLSELSAKKYASTMGAILDSMGLNEKATLDMSQALTGLTGDVASFYNIGVDEAFQKIRAGMTGETEPLKQLGINMSITNLEAHALSQGITKSWHAMTQSEKALLSYNYLMKVTATAQGDFARTSDSWANQTRMLTERWNTFKGTLGQAFIAVLKPVITMINTLISKLQVAAQWVVTLFGGTMEVAQETASDMDGVADSVGNVGDTTVETAKKIKNALAGFDKLNVLSSPSEDDSDDTSGSSPSDGSSGVIIPISYQVDDMEMPTPDTSGIEESVNKVKEMFGTVASYVKTQFAPSITSWGDAFKSLKKPLIEAKDSIKSSLDSLWNETLSPFRVYVVEEFAAPLVNTFSETVAPIFTDVMKFALEESAKDFDFYCEQVKKGIDDIATPAMDTFKTVGVDAMTIVKDEWDKSGTTILDNLGKMRDGIKEIWNNLYDSYFKPILDKFFILINKLWDNHLKPLWTNIVSFFSSFIECITTIWNNALAPWINWLIQTFGPAVTNVFSSVFAIVETIIGTVIDIFSSLFKILGGLLDFITGVFSGDWEKAWEGIKTIVSGIWDGIWAAIKGIINLIIDGVNSLWTAVYTVVSGIVNSIGGIAGALGDLFGADWDFSMPSEPPLIPKLARGGIISQPTLAMVGEKGTEAVVPLEDTGFVQAIAGAIFDAIAPLFANRNSSNSGSSEEDKIFVLQIGENEFGRISIGAINRYHNTIGKIELEV